jgi:hypothetical protein
MKSYVAITPVRDEELFLPGLISSMAAQSVRPKQWLIVDDGSIDGSGGILDAAAREHAWISVKHSKRNVMRAPGGEGILSQFFTSKLWRQADGVFRVDADVSFECDFMELVLEEFARDTRLGIASGTLYEPAPAGWREVVGPQFHTRGPTKIYSTVYLEAVGAPAKGLGWDTIDDIEAARYGFVARSFRHIHARHHRPQGTAQGAVRGRLMTGRAAYQVGYSPMFMLARAGRRSLTWPPLVGALAMLVGFAEGYVCRRPRMAKREVIQIIRREQWKRLLLMRSLWS